MVRRTMLQVAMAAASLLGCVPSAPGGQKPLVRVLDACTPMGTYMAVTVYAPDEASGRRAIAAAFQRVEEVEAATSTYREQSDVSKLNRAAGGPALKVSPHLWAVLHRAAEVSAETQGAFDVTVGPLVSLWKRTWKKGKPATDAEVAAAKALVDYRAVRLLDGSRAQLLKPGMAVELGGIAKGYAVAQAIDAIREAGLQTALVDAGGDIYALGAPPERGGWLIGVRDPKNPGKILPKPLKLRNQAVATSGDYEQYGTVGGHRYSHILDPRTGRPIEGMTSVTVVAPDATTADAYATATSVLGPKDAIEFAEKRPGIEMMILYRRGEQDIAERSSGFGRLEVSAEGGTPQDQDKPTGRTEQ